MKTASLICERALGYEETERLWAPVLKQFTKLLQFGLLARLLFLAMALFELTLFFGLLACNYRSTLLAFTLAMFFMTLFSYFAIKLYLAAKRPDQLIELSEQYLDACRAEIGYQEAVVDHYLALAQAAQTFAIALHQKEYTYYAPPPFLRSLAPFLEKWSCFCHWKDLHKMKELLLRRAVEQHVKVVKCEPTHLKAHAALANAYVMLSGIYADPCKYRDYDETRYLPAERSSESMQQQFRATAQRAIEEFKILEEYAPQDPWVHKQLAYSYHDLQMPEEEIRAYERVLSICPEDKETLFKLGILYFQQGCNAKGLKVYENLKKSHPKQAESLIKFYGN